MREIIGNTTATPNPRPDWAQMDESKVDYIKNKPKLGTIAGKNEIAKSDLASDIQESLGKADISVTAEDVNIAIASLSTTVMTEISTKVDKIEGKGLSTNDYTTEEKEKLASIDLDANPNVQSDWNQVDDTKDDYIKNKPCLQAGEGQDSLTTRISNPTDSIKESRAVAKYSTSLGASNMSGTLAFNIIDYDVDDMTYTLNHRIPEAAFNFKTGEDEVIPFGEDSGAFYSISFPSVNRHFVGRIISITYPEDPGNDTCIVKVSTNRPSLEIGNGKGKSDWGWMENPDTPNSCFFKLPYYPLAGDIPVGDTSFTSGRLNVAADYGAFSSGYNNISDGKYSVTLGRGNEAGWSSAAIGARNKSHGLGSYTFGLDNASTEMGAVAINQYNTARHSRAFVAGVANNSSASNQAVVGQYNADNRDALFIVGNGTGTNGNVTSRSNAFVVLRDGRAKITTPPQENMDVVNKNYVDTKETNLKNQINNVKIECEEYIDNSIDNLDISSGLEVETALGSSPVILDPQPAGTKMDLKFSYSDDVDADITYALYANNLLIKPTSDITLKNISSTTIAACDEYGVITIPAATYTGSTFFITNYTNNGLFPFANSGKITIVMHIEDEIYKNLQTIQLRFNVWYMDANGDIKASNNNTTWLCKPGIRNVVDLDAFTQSYGKIVGIDAGLAWNSKSSVSGEFKLCPAIYRGEVDADPLTIPYDLANSQVYQTTSNNSKVSISLPNSGITSIFAAYNAGVNSNNKPIYKDFENLVVTQIHTVSKLEAGDNIVFNNNSDVLTIESINTTYMLSQSGNKITLTGSDGSETSVISNTESALPTENRQAGAFLRLGSDLNPMWQVIPNAEDVAF